MTPVPARPPSPAATCRFADPRGGRASQLLQSRGGRSWERQGRRRASRSAGKAMPLHALNTHGRMDGPGWGVQGAVPRAGAPCTMHVVCAIRSVGPCALCAAGHAPNRGGSRPGLRAARAPRDARCTQERRGPAGECRALRCCVRAAM